MPHGSMRRIPAPIGIKFGRLTVLSEGTKSSDGAMLWLCVCDCGKRYVARSSNIRGTISCGCYRKEQGLDPATGHFIKGDPVDRFFQYVEKTSTCWNWTGGKDKDGYGIFWDGDRLVRAHRYSYGLFIGPIPDFLQPDHLCRNVACVNPDDLDPVTPLENNRRSDNPSACNRRKTECLKGHSLSGDNLYITPDGRRQCRNCNNSRSRKHKEAQFAAPSFRI